MKAENYVMRTVSIEDRDTGYQALKTRNSNGYESVSIRVSGDSGKSFDISHDPTSPGLMSVTSRCKQLAILILAIAEEPCGVKLQDDTDEQEQKEKSR